MPQTQVFRRRKIDCTPLHPQHLGHNQQHHSPSPESPSMGSSCSHIDIAMNEDAAFTIFVVHIMTLRDQRFVLTCNGTTPIHYLKAQVRNWIIGKPYPWQQAWVLHQSRILQCSESLLAAFSSEVMLHADHNHHFFEHNSESPITDSTITTTDDECGVLAGPGTTTSSSGGSALGDQQPHEIVLDIPDAQYRPANPSASSRYYHVHVRVVRNSLAQVRSDDPEFCALCMSDAKAFE